ncbi:MAG: protein-L-isoaspartate(D-aspartate) O-methyltransferase [Bacteroidia bacterium]|nr:protein-L-isoaspartate(D-aspartate) O-methyltransferase [Bacteroidia bacterium]NNF29937.1 protein-L-isoaspartate(D-aspartate) O-methyltransferase [Flavobacteriaceae bacterium]MBT8276083.1 protein-L-isoaspartate(D-aspartate) O-methyltransferase [Bacteroidia bacterium]NNJ82474.1 protein-L-isoaspartate(D-aspartate) O-methyltransferase [Flavobacteriaceae bacterium]NNK53642.1 protein-L-isoaspartate(D-aspartate) O-methyltransferase [Flavobacteriaceae bacterium]
MKKIITFIVCFVYMTGFAQDDFAEERKQMVKTQLEARDITDPATLQAMLKVPRHLFVPEKIKKYAYRDGALPIGNDQTISQPYIVAYMTQALQLKPQDKVLEIGTGSGYQAAVLAEIVDSVYTIEIVKPLGIIADKLLKRLGYTNIYTRIGDGYHGWPEQAPFDAIIVTAAVQEIPPKLLEQLGEGGRMIIPVGETRVQRNLILATKKDGKINRKKLIPVVFVPFTRDKN